MAPRTQLKHDRHIGTEGVGKIFQGRNERKSVFFNIHAVKRPPKFISLFLWLSLPLVWCLSICSAEPKPGPWSSCATVELVSTSAQRCRQPALQIDRRPYVQQPRGCDHHADLFPAKGPPEAKLWGRYAQFVWRSRPKNHVLSNGLSLYQLFTTTL